MARAEEQERLVSQGSRELLALQDPPEVQGQPEQLVERVAQAQPELWGALGLQVRILYL